MLPVLLAALVAPSDTGLTRADSLPAPVTPVVSYVPSYANLAVLHLEPLPLDADTVARRPRAVEHSDGYYTRLKIHQVASYATIPLFVAQYLVGQHLYNDGGEGARGAHSALAVGVAGLFAVNTVTGLWNLVEDRKNPAGRTRRWVHGLTMLAADAGFVAVGMTAPEDDEGGGEGGNRSLHRDLAIGSMGVALGSYLMMLLWKD